MIRVVIAVGAATAVLAAIVLGYAAATAATFDAGHATLLGLGSIWIGQALVALAHTTGRR